MSIVDINISQQTAPAPSTRQSTGALISQGATTLSAGTYSLLTQTADLTALLAAPLALTSLTWSGGTVTATTAAAISGLSSGDSFQTTIAGATPSGYNGTVLATVTGANTFTYPLATDPGAETSAGTYTPGNQVELLSMLADFYGQGSRQAVYVLELGASDATSGATALASFITANPNFFYGYLVPRTWDGNAQFLSLLAKNNSLSSTTYFYVTTTTGTYSSYPAATKCVIALVEAPSLPAGEFSLATAFQKALSYKPSSANRMTPFGNSFLYGVTPYPTVGNAALLAAIAAANVNVVGTGAEGQISNTILVSGTTLDGNDFSYWYSVDWLQINAKIATAAAVINGSNDSVNPLWYDQPGIDRLQDVVFGTVKNAITYGLAAGTVTRTTLPIADFLAALDDGDYDGQNVVNAEPWLTYLGENPSDYKAGDYNGITVAYIPARPFKHILLNVQVTDLVVAP